MADKSKEMARKKLKLSLKHRRNLPQASILLEASIPSTNSRSADEAVGLSTDRKVAAASAVAIRPSLATLSNMGNTCYLNSLLNALRCLVEFRSYLHELACQIKREETKLRKKDAVQDSDEPCRSNEADICFEIHEVFQNMRKIEIDGETRSLCPDQLLDALRKRNEEYDVNRQHDVHELMGCLLDCMEIIVRGKATKNNFKERLRTRKKSNDEAAAAVSPFHGRVLLRTVCLECETAIETEETFWDIPVPLSVDSTSENYSLAADLKCQEFLRDDNKVFCRKCYHLNEAIRSTHFVCLPKVLVLRATQLIMSVPPPGCENIYKANGKVTVPTEVPCIMERCPHESCASHEYDLKSVICHIGPTYSSGHYTAYVRNPPQTSPVNKRNCRKQKFSHNNVTCCDPVDVPCQDSWLHFDDDKMKNGRIDLRNAFSELNGTELHGSD